MMYSLLSMLAGWLVCLFAPPFAAKVIPRIWGRLRSKQLLELHQTTHYMGESGLAMRD